MPLETTPAATPGAGPNTLSGELQQLVDSCAADLRRSVAIDDMNLKMLAVSAHYGDEDPARLRALVGRGLDQATVDYLLGAGVASLTEPAWVEGNHELGLVTRLFVPVRCNDIPLGFLCLIDPDRSLPAETVERAARAAEVAGMILYRQLVFHEWEHRRGESLLRDLISSDEAVRDRAAREIREEALITGDAYTMVEVRIPASVDDAAVLRVRGAIESALRAEPTGAVMSVVGGRRVAVLARAESADRLLDRLAGLAADAEVIAGASGSFSGLDGAAHAFGEAVTCARAAELLPTLDGLARWRDLGVYAVLMRLPAEELAQNIWTPAIRRLAEGDSADLVSTAEEFLDCAGDSKRTAERLHIHRSTLYYRLARIEELTGLDLQEGGDRLLLHLGLKARHLAPVTRGGVA